MWFMALVVIGRRSIGGACVVEVMAGGKLYGFLFGLCSVYNDDERGGNREVDTAGLLCLGFLSGGICLWFLVEVFVCGWR